MQTIYMSTSNIKKYAPNAETVEGIEITEDTLEEAARWCGGEVRSEAKASDHTDVYKYVAIPSLTGPFEARIGSFLIKFPSTGKFDVVHPASFKQDYHVVGMRQDGVHMRGGLINETPITRPSGWGANSDAP